MFIIVVSTSAFLVSFVQKEHQNRGKPTSGDYFYLCKIVYYHVWEHQYSSHLETQSHRIQRDSNPGPFDREANALPSEPLCFVTKKIVCWSAIEWLLKDTGISPLPFCLPSEKLEWKNQFLFWNFFQLLYKNKQIEVGKWHQISKSKWNKKQRFKVLQSC